MHIQVSIYCRDEGVSDEDENGAEEGKDIICLIIIIIIILYSCSLRSTIQYRPNT